MNSEKAYLLAILFATWLMFVAFAGAFHPDFLAHLFDWGPTAPAWVQALGSIGAIAIAIWVPHRMSRRAEEREEKQRFIKARALSILIQPAVEGLCQSTIEQVKRLQEFVGKLDVVANRTSCLRIVQTSEIPSIDESLSTRVDQLYLLDFQVSSPLLELISFLPVYEAARRQVIDDILQQGSVAANFDSLKALAEDADALRHAASMVATWFQIARYGDQGAAERMSAFVDRKLSEELQEEA